MMTSLVFRFLCFSGFLMINFDIMHWYWWCYRRFDLIKNIFITSLICLLYQIKWNKTFKEIDYLAIYRVSQKNFSPDSLMWTNRFLINILITLDSRKSNSDFELLLFNSRFILLDVTFFLKFKHMHMIPVKDLIVLRIKNISFQTWCHS